MRGDADTRKLKSASGATAAAFDRSKTSTYRDSGRVPKTSIKEQFPLSLWVSRGEKLQAVHHEIAPSSLVSGQQWVAQEHPSCPLVELGKGCNTRVPASGHHTPGCHKP